MTDMTHSESRIMPDSAFAHLGEGQVAYVRQMTTDSIRELFPHAPAMAPGQPLWVLLAANGSPIVLADSREAVLANARENDLQTVSLQ